MPTHIPIVVAYKAPNGKKVSVKVFTDLRCPDKLITNRSTLLPKNCEIVQLGVGERFIKEYRKKYNL